MVLLVPMVALATNVPTDTPLRIIFVSSNTSDGNIGGLTGADSIVQAAANNPGSEISGHSVTAILSVVGTSAQSRFVDGGEPIYNTRGQIVANNFSEMFSGAGTSLANTILYDEAGNANDGIVWTGTEADGTLAPTHCTSYSTNSNQQDGRIGQSNDSDGQWVQWGTLNCVNPARLYGMTEVFAVHGVPTLGPASIGLLVLLLIGLASVVFRWRST